jgi:hypothetical protein
MRLELLHSMTVIQPSTAARLASVAKVASAATLALLLASGCTWIPLTDAGAQVNQATAAQVANCRQIGSVSSNTPAKVGVQRGRGKVAEELVVLARNEAANIGGDTIVPAGPAVDGRQEFNVYQCGL